MKNTLITMIPGARISVNGQPEVRAYCGEDSKLLLLVNKDGHVVKEFQYFLQKEETFKFFPEFMDITGDIQLEFQFYTMEEVLIESYTIDYEVIESSVKSTMLIDGCWISIYHWSEDEARWFNNDLKNLANQDWKEQIYDMNAVGIKGIVIQNVFHCNEYVGQHDMTADTYRGAAFYPSAEYQDRVPLAADNVLEAILSAADECGMNVFLGVGMYAWFDFSPESLKWHIRITEELMNLYGHHKSLYAWYVSEEIMGSLYFDYLPVPDEKYLDIVTFFREYKAFVNRLTPTKPVALAPNNIRFHEYEKEWKEILENIDILLPFAFARDPENMNIAEIDAICKACGTHLWVDMEMFQFPLDNGLVPKNCTDLIKEIRTYDMLEQVFGYQYTGIMNPPHNKFKLGGEDTVQLYEQYSEYYRSVKAGSKMQEGNTI